MNTSIEQIKTMVEKANGKPFTFDAVVKFHDANDYCERKFCFGNAETIDRLASDVQFDETIFYYVTSINEVKRVMEVYNGSDFQICDICEDGFEIVDYLLPNNPKMTILEIVNFARNNNITSNDLCLVSHLLSIENIKSKLQNLPNKEYSFEFGNEPTLTCVAFDETEDFRVTKVKLNNIGDIVLTCTSVITNDEVTLNPNDFAYGQMMYVEDSMC